MAVSIWSSCFARSSPFRAIMLKERSPTPPTSVTIPARNAPPPLLAPRGPVPPQPARTAIPSHSHHRRIGAASLLGLRIEPVAYVPHRLDHVLVLRPQLGADAADMHVHGADAAVVVVAPDLVQEGLAREDALPVR